MHQDPLTALLSSLRGLVASSRDSTPNGNSELQVILCSLPEPTMNGTDTGIDLVDKSIELTDWSKYKGRRVATLLWHLVKK